MPKALIRAAIENRRKQLLIKLSKVRQNYNPDVLERIAVELRNISTKLDG